MTRFRVRYDAVVNHYVGVMVVPMAWIVIVVVIVMRPRAINIAVDEHDERAAQIDAITRWRRVVRGNPSAAIAQIPILMTPHIVIHFVIREVVITDFARVIVRRRPRRRNIILHDDRAIAFRRRRA